MFEVVNTSRLTRTILFMSKKDIKEVDKNKFDKGLYPGWRLLYYKGSNIVVISRIVVKIKGVIYD